MLTYPTTYYFVFPHARYRHPIEPELVILVAFLLLETGKRATLKVAAFPSHAEQRGPLH
jgi:hypothetical protein